jgi:hypothetical protein
MRSLSQTTLSEGKSNDKNDSVRRERLLGNADRIAVYSFRVNDTHQA